MRPPFATIAPTRLRQAGAVLASIVLFAAPSGLAAESDRLKTCFTEWPPYAYVKDDVPAGLSVRVITEAARRSGLQASFAALPWARCLSAVEQGSFDVALDGSPRPTLIYGTTSHPVVVTGILVRSSIGRAIAGLDGLSGLVFGHPVGWTITPPLQALIDSGAITLARPVARDQVVAMMKARRVDFAYDAYGVFQRLARDAGFEVTPVPGTVTVSRLYPLVTRGRPALRDRLEQALAGMAADGTLDRLYQDEIGVPRHELLEAGQAATD